MSNDVQFAAGATRMEAIEKRLDKMEVKLDVITESMAKQRGFIAGVSMAFTLLFGAIASLAAYIWQKHFGG